MNADDLPPGCICLIDHQEPGCRLNLHGDCPVHSRPSSPVAEPANSQGHAAELPNGGGPHLSANGGCRCNCPRCMTGNACICSACNSPFHDHGSRSVAVPPAGPPDDADDPWWVARGEYQKAMDEADRLTVEAAGITAAAEVAWLAFTREYLKERKVDHA